jgi:putative FmdB family regulatory protein
MFAESGKQDKISRNSWEVEIAMPVYAYECRDCGVRFDRRQSFQDEALTVCPECEGSVHRLIQPAGIIFKGSGFYVTDNRASRSATASSSENGKSENGKSESTKAEGGKSEASSKSESTTKETTASSPTEKTPKAKSGKASGSHSD